MATNVLPQFQAVLQLQNQRLQGCHAVYPGKETDFNICFSVSGKETHFTTSFQLILARRHISLLIFSLSRQGDTTQN
jgi:hypothetical protein